MATYTCQATVLGPDFQGLGLCCPANNTGIERTWEFTGAGVTGPTAQRAETKDSQLCKKIPKSKVKKYFFLHLFQTGLFLKNVFLWKIKINCLDLPITLSGKEISSDATSRVFSLP